MRNGRFYLLLLTAALFAVMALAEPVKRRLLPGKEEIK
jgi:hypothetical protein